MSPRHFQLQLFINPIYLTHIVINVSLGHKPLLHSLLHKADASLHAFLRLYPLLERRISRLEELLVPGGGRPHL